jgi:hypothetical protein
MRSVLLGLALLVLAVAYIWPGNASKYPPGVLVTDEPAQNGATNGKSWEVKGYTIKPLADYRIRGRVLMTERYSLGRESDLSPLDLTLGWKRMSDQKVLDEISFTRERRAFCYRPKGSDFPIPAADINSQSANMHLIPANAKIEKNLRAVNQGDIIELRGCLVQVTAPDGWHWRSSLTRTDSGQGACELMWVTGLETLPVRR